MGSIRLRGRSLGPCMASGCGAMFASFTVSAVSVSARPTAHLRCCPCSQCRALHEYVPVLSTTEVQQSNRSCGDGGLPQGQTCYRSVSLGLRRRVVSNRAVLVHALPLILSRLLALPITSYFRLPFPLLSEGG